MCSVNKPALVQIKAWRWKGDKAWSEPLTHGLPTDICGDRFQWVNNKKVSQYTYVVNVRRSSITERFRCFGDLEDCIEGYTLAMWVRTGQRIAHTMYYFSSGGQTYASHGVVWYRRNDKLNCWFRLFNELWKVSAAMDALTWYHFTTTWLHGLGARMYRDGVLVDIQPNAIYIHHHDQGFNDVTLGKANRGDTYGEVFLDDMIVYEHIINTELVKYVYMSYFYWTFKSRYINPKSRLLAKPTLLAYWC